MAQKKLLSFLIILLCYLPCSIRAEGLSGIGNEVVRDEFLAASKDEADFIYSSFKGALQMTLDNMKEKFLELKKMEGGYSSKEGVVNTDFSNVVLKVFVSNSMSNNLLKSYIREARKYKASLVFNGLINGSFIETQKFIASLLDNKESDSFPSILINDEEFREFEVTSVPVVILVKEDGLGLNGSKKIFDKVIGNIGIKGALLLFASDGSLPEEAASLLGMDRDE